ncbi:uncharacterized protein LOC113124921 isoform X2 [Mastacembelus armatus]|uniref:uncharacterized protein LOC113124921 isoform X2 n=1 Tax=Mastacembelus armatus TaxID=205130 RepID=UPI000E45F28D|nr:uncharacterized protein LOC113124921 isoform X2 [Mastacembelus armatus]
MFCLETFESQVCAVMEALVDAAVAELDRLLDQVSSGADAAAAQRRSAPAPGKTMRTEDREERRRLNKDIKAQFASLMKSCTEGVVQKISMLLRMSICEAEDGLPAEKVSRLNDQTKAGRVSRPIKQCQVLC